MTEQVAAVHAQRIARRKKLAAGAKVVMSAGSGKSWTPVPSLGPSGPPQEPAPTLLISDPLRAPAPADFILVETKLYKKLVLESSKRRLDKVAMRALYVAGGVITAQALGFWDLCDSLAAAWLHFKPHEGQTFWQILAIVVIILAAGALYLWILRPVESE